MDDRKIRSAMDDRKIWSTMDDRMIWSTMDDRKIRSTMDDGQLRNIIEKHERGVLRAGASLFSLLRAGRRPVAVIELIKNKCSKKVLTCAAALYIIKAALE